MQTFNTNQVVKVSAQQKGAAQINYRAIIGLGQTQAGQGIGLLMAVDNANISQPFPQRLLAEFTAKPIKIFLGVNRRQGHNNRLHP